MGKEQADLTITNDWVEIPGLTPSLADLQKLPYREEGGLVLVDFTQLRTQNEQILHRTSYDLLVQAAFCDYRFPLESDEFRVYQETINPVRQEIYREAQRTGELPDSFFWYPIYERHNMGLVDLGRRIVINYLSTRVGEELANELVVASAGLIAGGARWFNPSQSPDPSEQIEMKVRPDGLTFAAFMVEWVLTNFRKQVTGLERISPNWPEGLLQRLRQQWTEDEPDESLRLQTVVNNTF